MKINFIRILCLILLLSSLMIAQNYSTTKNLYLGKEPPGLSPKIFAKGIMGCVFSNDGGEIFYFIFKRSRGKHTIMQSRIVKGQWSQPVPTSFSDKYSDFHPFLSKDGNKLFFGSNRRINSKKKVPYSNLWFTEKRGNTWVDPKPLSSVINTGYENCGTIGPDGELYFRSISKKGRGGDFFLSNYIDGEFQKPIKLTNKINSVYDESHPCLSPDGSYLIFSSKRPGGWNRGRDDLWISFKRDDDFWTKARNMGKKINTGFNTSCATISPDSKYLFYTIIKSGESSTFWVSTKIIKELEPK